jgi:small GTP-binding protein
VHDRPARIKAGRVASEETLELLEFFDLAEVVRRSKWRFLVDGMRNLQVLGKTYENRIGDSVGSHVEETCWGEQHEVQKGPDRVSEGDSRVIDDEFRSGGYRREILNLLNDLFETPTIAAPSRMSTDKKPTTYKIIVVGATDVGKTSIERRFVHDRFDENFTPTIGCEYLMVDITTESEKIRLEIWDTAGQERFHCVSKVYYRRSVGAALVFAVNDLASFQEVDRWREEVLKFAPPGVALILVGNKSDLRSDREVTETQAREYAEQHHLEYIETSAKCGTGVRELFDALVRRIGEKRASGELDLNYVAPQANPPQGTSEESPSNCYC